MCIALLDQRTPVPEGGEAQGCAKVEGVKNTRPKKIANPKAVKKRSHFKDTIVHLLTLPDYLQE